MYLKIYLYCAYKLKLTIRAAMRDTLVEPHKMENELKHLLKQYTGVKKILPDDDLEFDLGLTGDDAIAFLEVYSRNYKVDLSHFSFESYFYNEGQFLIFLFKKWVGKYPKRRLTLKDLLQGAQVGYLA